MVSGPGSDEFIEQLEVQSSLEVLGPNDGAWLVKSSSVESLSKNISEIQRPKKRLRVAIDPVRF